jgi:hypothetical protein
MNKNCKLEKIISLLIIGLILILVFIPCSRAIIYKTNQKNNNIFENPSKIVNNKNSPLILEVKANQMGHRKWKFEAFIKNSLNETVIITCCDGLLGTVTIRIFNKPDCLFPIWNKDGGYTINVLGPYEEKEVLTALFVGVVDVSFDYGQPPIYVRLTEGDYYVKATMYNHCVNFEEQTVLHHSEKIIFHLQAPKSRDIRFVEFIERFSLLHNIYLIDSI